jgi:hypothetical protein
MMASEQAKPSTVDIKKDYPNVENITRSGSETPISLDKAGIEEGKIGSFRSRQSLASMVTSLAYSSSSRRDMLSDGSCWFEMSHSAQDISY